MASGTGVENEVGTEWTESVTKSAEYRCRHFTKEWTTLYDKAAKGLAGENSVYRALDVLSREYHLGGSPTLLGEPDEVPEPPKIIARKSDFPDVYYRVDDAEFLFEAKNIFYYHAKWGEFGQVFYRQPPAWVKKWATEGKKWHEEHYPVRGTLKVIREGKKTRREYGQYITISNMQKVTPVYIATVHSYTPDAEGELNRFFGENQVFTNHAMLTEELVTTREDGLCSQNALGNLMSPLIEIIEKSLKDSRA